MRKSKLDKLICRENNRANQVNYALLDGAYDEFDSVYAERKVVAKESIHKKRRFSVLVSAMCAVLVMAIALPTMSVMSKNQEPTDDNYYCGGGLEERDIDSIQKYNEENGLNLLYLGGYGSDYEIFGALIDPISKKDLIIKQDIVMLDTYEHCRLGVSKAYYSFDMFEEYERLKSEIVINDIKMYYSTKFDESEYLYSTLVRFDLNGYRYRISLNLLEQDTWIDMLKNLTKLQ